MQIKLINKKQTNKLEALFIQWKIKMLIKF